MNSVAVDSEGYFVSPHHHQPRNPTVLEVLGPDYHKGGEEVFIDESVVDGEIKEASGERTG